jgi:hypothetical protein
MDDEHFITTLNRVTSENRLRLPVIDESPPSGDTISAWAEFLQLCVKRSIKLSDPRWGRVTIDKHKPTTVFELQGAAVEQSDPDFRVGLQLLMGMLEKDANP